MNVKPEEWYRLRFPKEAAEIDKLPPKELRRRYMALLGVHASADQADQVRLKKAIRDHPTMLVFVDDDEGE